VRRVPDGLRLAVSNIAWDPSEDDLVADVLRREGVSGIEVAPTKWRDKPLEATAAEVARYRQLWLDRGFRIVSLQALLFGRPDLELFGATRPQLAEYLRRVIELGAGLGAHALVFGSPKNRLRGSFALSDAMASAAEFFRDIGDFAEQHGVVLAIEANPAEYGCDFITRTDEAVALCRAIGSAGVGVNADLGGMTMAGDEPRRAIESAHETITHFHASEPNLAELSASSNHGAAAEGLAAIGYSRWVSVEMREAGKEKRETGNAEESLHMTTARSANVQAVARAVRLAKAVYASAIA
jgi:sugar phosphate isomerase/epimerase